MIRIVSISARSFTTEFIVLTFYSIDPANIMESNGITLTRATMSRTWDCKPQQTWGMTMAR
jgi:hypothetical protein